jgi:hypothetical protein
MNDVAIFRIRRHLDFHVDLAAREIGISALVLSDVAGCTIAELMDAIEKGLLPGYATMLMHEGKHIRVVLDKTFMSDFSIDLYAVTQSELSDRQRLQLQVARIIYTPVDEAKRYIATCRKEMPVIYLARLFCSSKQKTITRLLDAIINSHEKSLP